MGPFGRTSAVLALAIALGTIVGPALPSAAPPGPSAPPASPAGPIPAIASATAGSGSGTARAEIDNLVLNILGSDTLRAAELHASANCPSTGTKSANIDSAGRSLFNSPVTVGPDVPPVTGSTPVSIPGVDPLAGVSVPLPPVLPVTGPGDTLRILVTIGVTLALIGAALIAVGAVIEIRSRRH